MSTAVLLVDPKYPHNVGGVVRACSIFGVPELRWTGDRVHDNRSMARRAGTGISKRGWRLPREERMRRYDLDWGIDDGALDKFIERNLTPICIELVPGAERLDLFEHPEDAVYVFGPEDGHVPKGVRHVCHRFVEIPASGCLNLAAAVNVVLYDRCAKLGLVELEPIRADAFT